MKFFKTVWRNLKKRGPGEAIDQGGHYLQGYTMAKELSRWGTRKQQIDLVMQFAMGRELLQHPDGDLGEGSRRDLENWRRGAEAGASKK
jgi:hypothetical protein